MNRKKMKKRNMMSPTVEKEIEEKGRIISHVTRVNYVNESSKSIISEEVIDRLGLRWDDDYLEWIPRIKDGEQVFEVRRFRKASNSGSR